MPEAGTRFSSGFDPALATSTPDALSTIRTAVEFRFNAASGVSYRIEASTDLTQWDIIEPVIIGESAVVARFYSTENQPAASLLSQPPRFHTVATPLEQAGKLVSVGDGDGQGLQLRLERVGPLHGLTESIYPIIGCGVHGVGNQRLVSTLRKGAGQISSKSEKIL